MMKLILVDVEMGDSIYLIGMIDFGHPDDSIYLIGTLRYALRMLRCAL